MRFWPVAFIVTLLDLATKRVAVATLTPFVPHEVLGDVVRLTLAYNRGIVFGLPVRAGSRWFLAALAVLVALTVWRAYRQTPADQRWRTIALALLAGGAIGNAIDRVRWTQGVVDFVDIGVGTTRFWTFNVADAALTCGVVLLAIIGLKHRPEVAADIEGERP
jgi:signal peptidase II